LLKDSADKSAEASGGMASECYLVRFSWRFSTPIPRERSDRFNAGISKTATNQIAEV